MDRIESPACARGTSLPGLITHCAPDFVRKVSGTFRRGKLTVSRTRLTQRSYNVAARDDADQPVLFVNHWKTLVARFHHHLQDTRQWRRGMDRANVGDHDLCDRSFHQLVIMGEDRAGSEHEVSQEIELRHDANEMMVFNYGKSVEIVGLK
jgi:hypothetical protein